MDAVPGAPGAIVPDNLGLKYERQERQPAAVSRCPCRHFTPRPRLDGARGAAPFHKAITLRAATAAARRRPAPASPARLRMRVAHGWCDRGLRTLTLDLLAPGLGEGIHECMARPVVPVRLLEIKNRLHIRQ